MRQYLEQRLTKWLRNRIPAAKAHQLTSQNIFIFPSLFGFAYLFTVLIIFLLGTNYQNNIILMFSFLLASIFVTTMILAFQNLNGLSVTRSAEPKGFAQQMSYLGVALESTKKHSYLEFEVELTRKDKKLLELYRPQLEPVMLDVPVFGASRGVKSLPRVRVSSRFPFGLFTTWTRLDLDCQWVTYPKPIMPQQDVITNQGSDDDSDGSQLINQGHDDFFQLEPYQPGQPLSQVAWKQLARSEQWLSKSYKGYLSKDVWLNFEQMPAQSFEERLSFLSALVSEYSQNQQSFGLIIPGQTIEPGQGKAHQDKCLLALARA